MAYTVLSLVFVNFAGGDTPRGDRRRGVRSNDEYAAALASR